MPAQGLIDFFDYSWLTAIHRIMDRILKTETAITVARTVQPRKQEKLHALMATNRSNDFSFKRVQ